MRFNCTKRNSFNSSHTEEHGCSFFYIFEVNMIESTEFYRLPTPPSPQPDVTKLITNDLALKHLLRVAEFRCGTLKNKWPTKETIGKELLLMINEYYKRTGE